MIVYCRHGMTEANKQDQVCGQRWDIGLCHEGFEMAEYLGKKLVKVMPSTDCHIISSPMKRAMQTADVIAKNLYIRSEFGVHKGLAEWDMGDWDTVPFKTIEADYTKNVDPPNGENRIAFANRVAETYETLKKHNHTNLIIVGHGEFWIALSKYLFGNAEDLANGDYRILQR